jgi:hypothetical protein
VAHRCLEHDCEGLLAETHLIEDPRTGRPYRVKRLFQCPAEGCDRTWESREYPPSQKQLRTWSWLKTQPGVVVVITASVLGYRPRRLPPRSADHPRPRRLLALEVRLFADFCRVGRPSAAEQDAFLAMLVRARRHRPSAA